MKNKSGLQWNIHSVKVTKTLRDRYGECFFILKSGDEELRILNWTDREILELIFEMLKMLLWKPESGVDATK